MWKNIKKSYKTICRNYHEDCLSIVHKENREKSHSIALQKYHENIWILSCRKCHEKSDSIIKQYTSYNKKNT